jgi:hypothetical protein
MEGTISRLGTHKRQLGSAAIPPECSLVCVSKQLLPFPMIEASQAKNPLPPYWGKLLCFVDPIVIKPVRDYSLQP